MNFAAFTFPVIDLLIENPAGKMFVAFVSAPRFLVHRPILRTPEKWVKNSIGAGKNKGPKARLALTQKRKWNPVRVIQFAPL